MHVRLIEVGYSTDVQNFIGWLLLLGILEKKEQKN
jgi:hypothetical protein